MKAFLKRFPLTYTFLYWYDYARRACNTVFRPEASTREEFLKKCGYEPDLKAPKTYNEKLQWLRLYWRDPLAEKCADKVAAREYVAGKGFSDRLVPQMRVFDRARDVDAAWDSLPERFVLKGAHGSGMNVLCADKSKLDRKRTVALCRRWQRTNYWLDGGEWVYRNVPRRIVLEKYIETDDGLPPRDYKIYCFHGEPRSVMVATGRNEGRLCMDYFTPEWEHMPFKRHNPNSPHTPEKPPLLQEMLAMARVLSAPFPAVRVDLYCEKNQIWFGEMTFFPAKGMHAFEPFEYDLLFGSWLDMDRVPGYR